MKIPFSTRRRQQQGYVLLMTVGIVLVLGITLGSYLSLSGQEEQMVIQSQGWNASLATAEAGVDEALAAMNANTTPGGLNISGVIPFAANGWTLSANGNYGVSRTLANGSYSVVVSNDSPHTIYSTGQAFVPDTSQQPWREVKVTAQIEPLFNVGLGAVFNINLNGRQMYTDSYNSTNGPYGTGPIGTSGDVASQEGIVNIGNDTINGNVYLGPDASFTNNPNGTVNGTTYYDYNVQFPPVVLPTTDTNGNTISWQTAAPNSSGTYSFTNSIQSGGYYIINSSKPIYVAAGIHVTLQVTATSFNPGTITIGGGTTNSGSIVMYQDSGSVTLGGNATGGAIGNTPESFYYYGLPGVTSISFSGTASFVGAVYAPDAVLTLNGGGNSDNIMGSIIVGQVTDNGHWDVHYDVNLKNAGPSRGYIPTSWQEIR